jgi:hypothetical protein
MQPQPPGGRSQLSFGWDTPDPVPARTGRAQVNGKNGESSSPLPMPLIFVPFASDIKNTKINGVRA